MHEIVKFIKSGFKLLFVVSIKPWNQIIFKFCTSDDALHPLTQTLVCVPKTSKKRVEQYKHIFIASKSWEIHVDDVIIQKSNNAWQNGWRWLEQQSHPGADWTLPQNTANPKWKCIELQRGLNGTFVVVVFVFLFLSSVRYIDKRFRMHCSRHVRDAFTNEERTPDLEHLYFFFYFGTSIVKHFPTISSISDITSKHVLDWRLCDYNFIVFCSIFAVVHCAIVGMIDGKWVLTAVRTDGFVRGSMLLGRIPHDERFELCTRSE